jgi:hypothetical protein
MKNALYPAADLHGSVALPFVIPSISTCLRQVEGEMTRGLSALATNAWPIQAFFFFWLEWGRCGPNPPLGKLRGE